jgi:pectate lyase C
MRILINSLSSLAVLVAVFSSNIQNAAAANIDIYDTITVAAGTTYDGYGNTIIAHNMGDGSQSEGQKYIFRLEYGANLQNVNIANPGCGGVVCYGNNVITNVNWLDVGEDALTVNGGPNITINGGYANYAADKVFQVNASCTLNINNFSSYSLHTFVRQDGGSSYTTNTFLNGVTLDFCNTAIAVWRTDSSVSKVFYNNLTVYNFNGSHGWWYDRASQARTMSDPVYLSNVATGMVIDGFGYTDDGANCMQYQFSYSNNQRWKLQSTDAFVKIQNVATGKYLDGMGRSSNTICGQYGGSGSYNQQWTLETYNSYIRLKNRGTGVYVDGFGYPSNSNLMQYSGGTSSNQRWNIGF